MSVLRELLKHAGGAAAGGSRIAFDPYESMIANVSDVIVVVGADGRVRFASASARTCCGYEPAAVLGHSMLEYIHPDDAGTALAHLRRHAQEPAATVRGDYRIRHADGHWLEMEAVSHCLTPDGPAGGIVLTLRDISQRKRMETALTASEARLRQIIENAADLFYSHGPDHVLTYMSPQTRQLLDCEPAEALRRWTEFLTDHPVNALGAAATQRAIDTGIRQPPYELELVGLNGRRVWVQVNEAPVVRYGRTVAIVGALTDITARKRQDEALAAQARRIEQSMEATIRALAGTVELRDLYTAGHQHRVATISADIGRKLGLEADRLRGLELAADIHDIGKLCIPAEILSKPGRLTPVELDLMKTHPEAGAKILDGIEFPWPIREMVWQHHERMDGSGYPRGLKGDAILLESRILAVADVVEAIASHRPYRPARGLRVALDEIARGRGSIYDTAVADACLAIFAGEPELGPAPAASRAELAA